MGEYTLPAWIVGIGLLIAAFELLMAAFRKKEGVERADWVRARGIVWVGLVLAALAWFVRRLA